MASENKFVLKHVEITEGDDIRTYDHQQLIPPTNKRYTLHLEGDILQLKEGGNLQIFPAHQKPTEASCFGFSALAMAIILRQEGESPLFVVIRRGSHLRAFPGKLAFPGGYMDRHGGQPYATAICELREETGEWAPYWVCEDNIAIIDSVPTTKHHNITAIVLVRTRMHQPRDAILSRMIPQKSEVDDVYLMTFDKMQEHIAEFTPGIQKMLNVIQIDINGKVSWN